MSFLGFATQIAQKLGSFPVDILGMMKFFELSGA
jgi:hypothetical protein